METRIKIATVYTKAYLGALELCAMNTTRWLKVSECLAKSGRESRFLNGNGTFVHFVGSPVNRLVSLTFNTQDMHWEFRLDVV